MIDSFFENTAFLFFPLTVYIIYVAYAKNLDIKEKESLINVSLFGALYLLFRKINNYNYIDTIIFINSALLICYLKKHFMASIVMSVLIVFFLNYKLNISIVFLTLEYVLYLVSYIILYLKNKINLNNIYTSFVLIHIFFSSFIYTYYYLSKVSINLLILKNVFPTFILLLFSYITLYLFKKCEGIINFNSTVNELNREKEIKTSLFKITHEIKNPLSVCRGYLDMILMNDYNNYKKYIPIINSEINRTLNLMDDFLDYTKLKIEKEEVDIVYMLEELKEEFAPLLEKNSINFELSIPDDEIYVNIDYKRFKQVLVNIIKNSIEARKESMNIKIFMRDNNNNIEIIIEDTGVGMQKEVLQKIGENFYTTKPRGTGLGVSLSKEIIKLHGGSIKYESEVSKGTTVFINLPKAYSN
ncbi:MAG: HAMP domain-containing histidine kinase [Bacilli bacterium]|nr:HAMP domain-containing histidine kinase [Bacilli bacterium]